MSERNSLDREAEIVRNGSTSIRVGEEVWAHVRSEFVHDLDGIMATVALEDPLAYALPNGTDFEGDLHLILSREKVREHYAGLYEMCKYNYWRPSIEIKTPWYTLFDGISENTMLGDGSVIPSQSAIFFPMSEQKGILGEMVWSRVLGAEMGEGPNPGFHPTVAQRDQSLALFNRFLDAARNQDAAAIAALFKPKSSMIVRSYATGATAACVKVGPDGIEAFHSQLFSRFEIEDVQPVNLIVTEWYAFADLQWQVKERATGKSAAFRTAEIFGIAAPGVFVARMGWGTDVIPQGV